MLQVRRRVSAPLLWGMTAVTLGTALQIAHVAQVGSLEATLRVGAESDARPFIEDDFGRPVPVTAGHGHDGWRFFLTAQDPFALDDERRPVYRAYRYRRVLGPLLAGGFGTFPAPATVLGLNVIGVLGFGLAVGTTAALASPLGARAWVPLGALLNVGLWLSIELVTADTLTLGLALLAVYLSLRHRPAWAAVAMTLAVLAKETSILFAAGLVIWLYIDGQRGAALRMAVLPIGAIATWMLYLESVLGGAFKSNSNLGLHLSA